MPRPARLNIPGITQHVTQRGNNRPTCFYTDEDYRVKGDGEIKLYFLAPFALICTGKFIASVPFIFIASAPLL
jgi:hypothetical protein